MIKLRKQKLSVLDTNRFKRMHRVSKSILQEIHQIGDEYFADILKQDLDYAIETNDIYVLERVYRDLLEWWYEETEARKYEERRGE